MYGEWFFRTWYEVVVPTYRNVLPIMITDDAQYYIITTLEELDSI